MRVFFTMMGLLLAHVATAQVVIQGKVVDVMTRKPLQGAKVQLDKQEVFVQTAADGSFTIGSVDPGYHTVTASFDGYESESSAELLFTYDKSPFIALELQSMASGVGEVNIRKTNIQKREAESPVSSQKLSIREIERNPGGNRDISKIIQSLPGVISVPGFRNDVVIRGGAPSENKFYLDGIEIPIINHFQTQGSTGGPVGLLNVNFIKEVNFYTGAFPVNYANGLSSVLDFRQMDGNANKAKYRFTLGSSDVGFTADGPIGKKTTYIFSARQSYLQGLFSVLGLPFLPNFIDYQAKVKVKLNEKDDISFLMVGAVDFFRLNLKVNDNITDSVQLKSNKYILGYLPVYRQWNYTFGTVYTHYGTQSKTQYFLSRNMLNNTSYKYRNNDESSEDNRIFTYKSIEEENKLRIENSRTIRKWKLLAGTGLEYVQFGVDNKAKILIPGAPGTPGTIQDIAFNSQLDLAKYSGFVRAYRNVMGSGTLSFAGRLDGNTYNKHMQNVFNQPTASVSASLPTAVNGLFLNANIGQFTQLPSYTILGYRNAAGALDNLDRVKYIRNRMVAAGLQYNKVKDTRITLEGFYKQYANYPLALNDSISLGNLGTDFAVVGNEPVSSVCDGRAYGMEFLVQRRSRSGLYGILAYTLSWSEFSDKNGNAVKSAWDSRHTVSLVGGMKMKRNWELGAKFRLATGRPYTPFDVQRSLVKSNWDVKGVALNDYNRLNSERLGTFSQLDVRVDKVWYFKKSSLNLYMDIQNFLNKEYLGAPTLIAAQDASGNLITDPTAAVPSYKADYLVNSTGFLQPSIGVILDF
ncbi:MAG: TonB-dependent receptor [Bacteroidetes bacterium]|nr:TonB-dependent receptor [Bacteroidota bacterium]NBX64955.1 TonB-dependent receptor [Bacteroidota bacterium]